MAPGVAKSPPAALLQTKKKVGVAGRQTRICTVPPGTAKAGSKLRAALLCSACTHLLHLPQLARCLLVRRLPRHRIGKLFKVDLMHGRVVGGWDIGLGAGGKWLLPATLHRLTAKLGLRQLSGPGVSPLRTPPTTHFTTCTACLQPQPSSPPVDVVHPSYGVHSL